MNRLVPRVPLLTCVVAIVAIGGVARSQPLGLKVTATNCSVQVGSQAHSLPANADVSNGYALLVQTMRGTRAASTLEVTRTAAAYDVDLVDETAVRVQGAGRHVAPGRADRDVAGARPALPLKP